MKSLADFQKEFSAGLRRPLEVRGGQLLPARDLDTGVAIYNRQYWLRLLNILQNEYPLLVRLLGAWEFNLLMQKFLGDFPPGGYDVQSCADPLPHFLQTQDAPRLWQEAAAIDQARRQVFLAGDVTPWQLSPDLAADLGRVQLHPAPTWVLIQEHSSLIAMTLNAATRWEAWSQPRHWLIQRLNGDLVYRILLPEQARLLKFLREVPIAVALATLEKEYPSVELPQQVQSWMALSLEWELWAIP